VSDQLPANVPEENSRQMEYTAPQQVRSVTKRQRTNNTK